MLDHDETISRSSADKKVGDALQVLIVADNASEKFGGESILPLHYFRELNARQIPTRMIVHARVRDELKQCVPGLIDKIEFVEDTFAHRIMWKLSRLLPRRFGLAFSTSTLGFLTAIAIRKKARKEVTHGHCNIVHQPTPVSPKAPSIFFGLGAPVVIGPMNGGMDYPPCLADRYESKVTRLTVQVLRLLCEILNIILPGKYFAKVLLVANERTRQALPWWSSQRVIQLVENGVALRSSPSIDERRHTDGPVVLMYTGRLIDWKGVDLLIRAFGGLQPQVVGCRLEIVGDGPMRKSLEKLVEEEGVSSYVTFVGQLPHAQCLERMRQADIFVLPSLLECGGAVVLEAMTMGVPVIATNWGGPTDYITSECGILVEPDAENRFVENLRAAMTRLVESPELRRKLGTAGAQRVEKYFTWHEKINRTVEIYNSLVNATCGS